MSLLDDVSIVVTPNGYKAGTLFAVKPTIAYGSELVVNGDFSQGDTGWTIEAVWTISGGAAQGNSANGSSQELKQTILEVGKTYEFSYEIRNRVSGSVELLNSGLGSTSSNEVYKSIGIATSTELRFRPSSFNGDIYNVSVREFTGADMDVTRATAATRVDENGLVNYAEIVGAEEVTNGDFATDTDWTKGTGWTISGGTANFTPSGSFINLTQSGILTSGKNYTVVYTLSNVTAGNVRARLGTQDGGNSSSDGTYTSIITANGADFSIRTNGTFSGSVDNVSIKEVTRDNVPRIDYTGGGCPHILAEPQRTNTLTYSEDFSEWITSGTTPTLTTGQLSPSGENNATKISGTIGSSLIYLAGSSSSTTATRTIYARTVSGTGTARLMSRHHNVNNLFTLTEEWTRFELTGSDSLGGGDFYIDMRGSQTLSEFIIWGAQSEEATYATSYIPNFGTAAGVTRNQDIFTRDGIGSLINSTEGVLFLEVALLDSSGFNWWLSITDGTSTNSVAFVFESTGYTTARLDDASGNQAYLSYAGDYSQNRKLAFKWKASDFALWIDGYEVVTTSSGSTFASGVLNSLQFSHGSGSNTFNGKVRQLQVYDTALTDEQLLQLTGESGTDFYESYAEMASALTYTIQ